MSDGITITPNTQAQKVREELFRITGQEVWNRDEYWKYYLRGRKDIFDAIYKDVADKDWLNPVIAKRVEEQYILRAKERWEGPDERWALEGEWLDNRPDIVAWLRSTYWKPNQKRIKERQLLQTTSASSATGDGEVANGEVSGGRGDPGGKRWQDVVLQK